MIQSAQVASKFTLFTHHAKTFPNLVTALRNSMLRAGTFKDERTAEEQVVQVLNFDIHLVKDFRGRRYIERVTECIPVEEKNEYTFDHRKEKSLEGKFDKFFDNATIFFSKTTNRELYHYRNILEFVDDSYVLVNPISETNIKEMRNNMEDVDAVAFDKFLERNWGIKSHNVPVYDENGNEMMPETPKMIETIESVPSDVNRSLDIQEKPVTENINIQIPEEEPIIENTFNEIEDVNNFDVEFDNNPVVEEEKTEKNNLKKKIKITKHENTKQNIEDDDEVEDPYKNLFGKNNNISNKPKRRNSLLEGSEDEKEDTFDNNNFNNNEDDDDEGFDL